VSENRFGEVLHKLKWRLWTKKCEGCDDSSFHTHHLTRLGSRKWT
jgi:hypothetical protein